MRENETVAGQETSLPQHKQQREQVESHKCEYNEAGLNGHAHTHTWARAWLRHTKTQPQNTASIHVC